MALGALLVRWLLSAAITMAAVRMVSGKNPNNTLARALGVTLVAALLVTPFSFFWFLLIPGLIALLVWTIIYTTAYDLRVGQAFAVGIVQAALGWLIDAFFVRGRLG
jgi:hypothetical protein